MAMTMPAMAPAERPLSLLPLGEISDVEVGEADTEEADVAGDVDVFGAGARRSCSLRFSWINGA